MNIDRNKMFYNQRPYIYAVLGIIGLLFSKQSKLAGICGLILLACAYIVYEMRKSNQKIQDEFDEKHSALTEKINKDKNKTTLG